MKFEIRDRFTGAVLFALKTESTRLCVEAAVKAGANLSDANLSGAYLSGADLSRANLSRAYLGGSNGEKLVLVGTQPIIQIGPIGSRADTLTAFFADAATYVRTGCFFGSLDQFREAVHRTHATSKFAREYLAAIAQIELHAEIWSGSQNPEPPR